MSITSQLAKHFRDVHSGGNWTTTNLKTVLEDVTREQAVKEVPPYNTILKLVYHTHYYVHEVLKVLDGGALEAHDKYSFDHPTINSQDEWEQFLEKVWSDAETFAQKVEQLDDSILLQDFTDKKYGTYYRNLHGIIEHTHYHLGQIVLIKKML